MIEVKSDSGAFLFEGRQENFNTVISKFCINYLNFKNKERVLKRNHPDIIEFGLDETKNNDKIKFRDSKKEIINMNQARNFRKEVHFKPIEEEIKVYVVYSQNIPHLVQNVFLKVLEEPPVNVYFLFLCQNCKILLPTVLSRLIKIGSIDVFIDEKVGNFTYETSEIASLVSAFKDNNEYLVLKIFNKLGKEKKDKSEIIKILLEVRIRIMENNFSKKNILISENLQKAVELVGKNVNLNLVSCILF